MFSPAFSSNRLNNRNARRTASNPAVHFSSEALGSHRSFTAPTNFNPFNRHPSNSAPSASSVRLVRPASRLPAQPTSSRVNPLLNGPLLRVVNHFDQPIGLSRPGSVNSRPPPTSDRSRSVPTFNGPTINSVDNHFNANNMNRINRSLQPHPLLNETHFGFQPTEQCLRCICEASTGCDLRQRCNGQFCGPYLLSWPYWQDAGSPGANFYECANDINCAQTAVRTYMRKHAQDCDRNGQLTCDDFAAVHQLGGASCAVGWEQVRTSLYWNNFKRCFRSTMGDDGNHDRERTVVRRTPALLPPSRPSQTLPPPQPPTNAFSIEDRPEEDPGNELGDFRG